MGDILVSHLLIGSPGSGKSTVARQWVIADPRYSLVSTDEIRGRLYGDPQEQGNWSEVEREVLRQITVALREQRPVIYDATNAQRPWRIDLLQKFQGIAPCLWMGWQLKTPLEICKAQNRLRDRQVPDAVIEYTYESLQRFPPETGEGFADVQELPLREGVLDFEVIQAQSDLKKLQRRIQSRMNKAAPLDLHPYSRLVDFERLLHLIALVLQFPGLGQLGEVNPSLLKQLLGQVSLPQFQSGVEEIAAVMAKCRGLIYADPQAIAQDLQWLMCNGLVNAGDRSQEALVLDRVEGLDRSALHRYSDRDIFCRLINVIRFMVHHPMVISGEAYDQKSFVSYLEERGILPHGSWHNFRRDIGKVLKTYQIMENKPMREGYFLGTAILAPHELLKLAQGLESQAKHLQDPVALEAYGVFQERLKLLGLDRQSHYPVRRVINHPIFSPEFLPPNSLAQPGHQAVLEEAIVKGQSVELRRLRGTGRHAEDQDAPFRVWPLQIVYYNVGWYLGYERESDGLFRFDRIDRLEAKPMWSDPRDRVSQVEALERLVCLQEGSYSLFLGNSPELQQKFLSPDPAVRAEVTAVLELWFTDKIFRFTSEGTQRLPKLQMSPRLEGASMSSEEKRKIFTLKRSKDPRYPNRFKAVLPHWSVQLEGDDYELMKWVMQFGDQVKVVSPDALRRQVFLKSKKILSVYQEAGGELNP